MTPSLTRGVNDITPRRRPKCRKTLAPFGVPLCRKDLVRSQRCGVQNAVEQDVRSDPSQKKNGAALSDRAAHISTANCLSYWLPADSRLASHLRERLLPLRLVVLLVPVIVSVATVPVYSIFMLFVP